VKEVFSAFQKGDFDSLMRLTDVALTDQALMEGVSPGLLKQAIRQIKQAPQGAVIPIHYNPENHAEGYIFTDVPFWELYTLPFVVALFGVFILLVATGIGFVEAYSG